ncbi:MAG: hypothetical protein KJ970_15785 [Candidatus Eisenbacteria bacterium]|uniref:Uncharacterized protein n=1 Tax=Eiseniibacteriota bacterium TaxID=2212470 RepID=A0A948RZD9_UNCEI|nr:hypothetical protein [Candidatus Eisenbacteria bacterium]MBU1949118.1 hypothetical protein [Candidatus Eisenbacteria bacterium]MBU2692384.1 hypothetical protein [Candidatus Eisenbacteria bacterium]
MQQAVTAFIAEIQSNPIFQTYDVEAIKQGLVLPLLNHLGWNPFKVDELVPGYRLEGRKAAYALRGERGDLIPIEVVPQRGNAIQDIAGFIGRVIAAEVPMSIATTGIKWRIHLLDDDDDDDDRSPGIKEIALDFMEEAPAALAPKLISLLAKAHVADRSYLSNAKVICSDAKVTEKIIEALTGLISKPNQELIKLVTEEAEDLAGKPIAPSLVEGILKSLPIEKLLETIPDKSIVSPARTAVRRKTYTKKVSRSKSADARLERERGIIEDLKKGDLTYREIAKKYNVSLPTVNTKARKAGIVRPRGRRSGAKRDRSDRNLRLFKK